MATETSSETMAAIPWEQMEALSPKCTDDIDREDMTARAGTIAAALANGATIAELARIAAAPKASRGTYVTVSTRYGALSRGKAWGRQGTGSSVTWADKDGGAVHLSEGKWDVGSDDGFSRKEKATRWVVTRIAGVLIAE